jgi:hypothetical protein
MHVREIVEDAVSLYRKGRFHSAFALALIAVEAAAKIRYPEEKNSSKRFKKFLNDEAQSLRGPGKYGVDLPPKPSVPECPPPVAPDPADANWSVRIARIKEGNRQLEEWQRARDRAYEDYKKQVKDVGDDFRGPGGRHLGMPRLVTRTGILYQARCDTIHPERR